MDFSIGYFLLVLLLTVNSNLIKNKTNKVKLVVNRNK